jgi:membrane protein required for colicin V production
MTLAIDVLLVICFLLTLIAGVRNGFFRELFALAGLAVGVVLAMRFTPVLLAKLPHWFGRSTWGAVLVFLILFLVVSFAFTLTGRAFGAMWEGKNLSGASRALGLLLGAARGLCLVVVLAGALSLLAPPGSRWLGRSHVLPYLTPGVVKGAELLPRDLRAEVVRRWELLPFGAPNGPKRQRGGSSPVVPDAI